MRLRDQNKDLRYKVFAVEVDHDAYVCRRIISAEASEIQLRWSQIKVRCSMSSKGVVEVVPDVMREFLETTVQNPSKLHNPFSKPPTLCSIP